jgi:hypothetical protein
MPLSIKELLTKGAFSETKRKIKWFLDDSKFDGYYTWQEIATAIACSRTIVSEWGASEEGRPYRIFFKQKVYYAKPSIVTRDFPNTDRKAK